MVNIVPAIWHDYDLATGVGTPDTPLTGTVLTAWGASVQAAVDAAAASAADADVSAAAAAAPGDAAVAGYIANPTSATRTVLSADFAQTVSGKLPRSAASIAAFEALRAALADGTRSTGLQVLGDSTGAGPTRWPYRLTQALAPLFPAWTFHVRNWDDANTRYAAPVIIQTGTDGARYLDCSTGTTSRQMPAALSPYLPGVIDVRLKMSMGDWTPAALKAFVGKSGSDPDRGWYCGILASGSGSQPFFTFSTGGLSADLTTMSVVGTPTVADGATIWMRWVFTPNNGASGRSLSAYQSNDGISWTQIGATTTTAGAVTIYNNSAIGYSLGSSSGNSVGDTTAKIYEVDIRNGPNGFPSAPRLPDLWPPCTSGVASTFGGAPVFTTVNGSISGGTIAQLSDVTRQPRLISDFGQAVTIMSASHNEGAVSSRTWVKILDDWRTGVEAVLSGVPTVFITQNPETSGATWYLDHARRRLDTIAYARAKGLDVIDTWKAFLDYGAWEANLMADTAHPNPAGSDLQVSTIKAHFDAS